MGELGPQSKPLEEVCGYLNVFANLYIVVLVYVIYLLQEFSEIKLSLERQCGYNNLSSSA